MAVELSTNWLVWDDAGMVRDAAETKKRLLEAAVAEFATYGIAGARVDRIAAQAGSNKSLIYTYFGNKDDLFNSVFESLVVGFVEQLPLVADDLPGYAASLFDHYQQRPEILRLATWYRLERAHLDRPPTAVTAANAAKVAAIKQTQREGRISDRIGAAELLGVVLAISTVSALAHPGETATPSKAELKRRRDAVVVAVERLVAPE
jgi:AcrR family transcriptional regulator